MTIPRVGTQSIRSHKYSDRKFICGVSFFCASSAGVGRWISPVHVDFQGFLGSAILLGRVMGVGVGERSRGAGEGEERGADGVREVTDVFEIGKEGVMCLAIAKDGVKVLEDSHLI